MRPAPPQVFVHYQRPAERDRALHLANTLRRHGVDAWIDLYVTETVGLWPRWLKEQIAAARWVLVVVSSEADDASDPALQRRAAVVEELLDGRRLQGDTAALVPVLIDPSAATPSALIGLPAYQLPEQFVLLLRHLTQQPAVAVPPLGSFPELSAITLPAHSVFSLPLPVGEPAEALAAAYAERERLLLAGESLEVLDQRILSLRRVLRSGPALHPGEHLGDGRFRLVREIGSGGFARVWLAWDQRHQRPAAIKVLHGQWCRDESRRERFFRGARRMAELRHPAVVPVLQEHGEDSGFVWFAMAHMPGGDLHQAILAGRLTARAALAGLSRVGEALTEAHERGWVHRDVKPHNILLDEQGRLYLSDFDLVGVRGSTGGTRTGALGAFLYAAPEMMHSAKEADHRADVYGLAMTAIFCLHATDIPYTFMRDPGFITRLEAPGALRQVLEAATDWDRERRTGSIAVLCAGLDWPEEPQTITRGGLTLAEVPGGVYWIGSPEDEAGRWSDEGPRHQVRLSGFHMATVPVTQEQWLLVMGENPSHHKSDLRRPVEQVSWLDAARFCNRLSKQEGMRPVYYADADLKTVLDGVSDEVFWDRSSDGFRLPTESEWEAACRGGTSGPYSHGDDEGSLSEAGWYLGNAGVRTERGLTYYDADGSLNREKWKKLLAELKPTTHPVGQKAANPLGLYDLHGNVWEWCWDWYDDKEYDNRQPDKVTIVTNPCGPKTGDHRVLRGGSFADEPRVLRSACRGGGQPSSQGGDIGFRCVLPSLRQLDP